MKTVVEYLRLILFMAGVLIGIQIPSFTDQYGKALQSRLSESDTSLSQFQGDADRYFGGDIHKLIAHYKSDKDPVFNDGGQSISAIMERKTELEQALHLFKENAFSAYYQTFFNPITDIRAEVLENYTYSIILNSTAIAVGLLFGLVFSALVESIIKTLIWLLGFPGRAKRRVA